MPTTTLADLLSDLRAVASGYGREVNGSRDLRHGAIDNADALIELEWIELFASATATRLRVTDAGLDVLYATQHVVLPEAA